MGAKDATTVIVFVLIVGVNVGIAVGIVGSVGVGVGVGVGTGITMAVYILSSFPSKSIDAPNNTTEKNNHCRQLQPSMGALDSL